jgi:hypothetical protein
MTLFGLKVYLPTSDKTTQAIKGINDWTTIKTYTTIVEGAGPFLVGIDATDYGGISGIAAAVLVDGEVYSVTGVPDSEIKLRAVYDPAKESSQWSSSTEFNDADWMVATGNPRSDRASAWGNIEARVAAVAGAPVVRMAWAPSQDAINMKNYARLVITPPCCRKLLTAPLFSQ